MTCDEISKYIPAYLEDDLTPEERKFVDEHINTCDACRQDLADFKNTFNILKDLPDVEPPPFFEQKIMSRIHEEATQKKGLLRKLFYPLRIKIPIQAMATVCIAVFAFLIYKGTESDLKRITPLPPPGIELEKSAKVSEQPSRPSPAPSRIGKDIERPDADKDQSSGTTRAAEQNDLSEKSDVSQSPLREEPYTAMTSKRQNEAVKRYKILTPEKKEQEQKQKAGAYRSTGMAIKSLGPTQEFGRKMSDSPITAGEGLYEQAAPSLSERLMSSAASGNLYDLTLQVTDMNAAVREITNYIKQIDGRVIERFEETGNSFMKVEVLSGSIPALLERLNQIGHVQTKKDSRLLSDEKVRVLIQFSSIHD